MALNIQYVTIYKFNVLYFYIICITCFLEHWTYKINGTIRTLANSALVNSDPILFGPSQFGL